MKGERKTEYMIDTQQDIKQLEVPLMQMFQEM